MGVAVNRINPEIWSLLRDSQPSGDNLHARLPFAHMPRKFYCALDVNGARHFLLKLSDEDQDLRDNQSRGLTVTTRELVLYDNVPSRFLDIECKEVSGYSALDLIGGEIIDELSNSHKKTVDIVKCVLGKWRRFWGQLPQQILTKELQIGLFAELWFIHFWLFPYQGMASIFPWRGPWGSRHDFEWSDKSVEVKATTGINGRIFIINGVDQLEPPTNGPLYLFAMSLREESGASYTLPSLVKRIEALINEDADALTRFESALFQIGYSPVHEEEYLKLHLRVTEELLFSVKDNFPRITKQSFPANIPTGIERIEYSINLSGFNHLIAATKPNGLPFI